MQKITSVNYITPVEIDLQGNSSKKVILCCYGGLLVLINFNCSRAQRDMKKYCKNSDLGILPHNFCYFNPESLYVNPKSVTTFESVEDSKLSNACIIVNDGILDIFSTDRGNIIFQMDLSNRFVEEGDHHHKKSLSSKEKGNPSCVHWCKHSQDLFVGYTSGEVEMFSPKNKNLETSRPIKSFQAYDTHGAKITAIVSSYVNATKNVIIVGDVSGKISSWVVASSKDINKVYETNSHSSEIIDFNILSTESVGLKMLGSSASSFTLISCSKNTEIRVWLVYSDGSLSLISLKALYESRAEILSMSSVIFRLEESSELIDGIFIFGFFYLYNVIY